MRKTLLLLLIISGFQFNTFCNNSLLIIDENKIGMWAVDAHYNICKKIQSGLLSGKLTSFNSDFKKLSKQSDIDSLIVFGKNNDVFKTLLIKEKHIGLSSKTMGEIYLLKDTLYQSLNKDEITYIENFNSNQTVCFDSIPSKSLQLVRIINKKLLVESGDYYKRTFYDESLKEVIQGLKYLDYDTLAGFVQTNPNDPTAGYDTIFVNPYNVKVDSKQGIFISLSFDILYIKTIGISSGYTKRANIAVSDYSLFPLGYIEYEYVNSLTQSEKNILGMTIRHLIQDHLSNGDFKIDKYKKLFNLN